MKRLSPIESNTIYNKGIFSFGPLGPGNLVAGLEVWTRLESLFKKCWNLRDFIETCRTWMDFCLFSIV